METTRTLPPVSDPVQPDVDDLVIKEARRRARRRRWRFWGVGATLVALLGVAAACGPRFAASTHLSITPAPDSAALVMTPFVSLPPEEGVLPSAPAAAELVAIVPTEHWRVWLYEDGRLITMHMFPFTQDEWPNSGFVMQRLTPEGVELLRSYVADHIGSGNLDKDTEPPYERGGGVHVRVDDKVYRSVRSGQPSTYWRCYWSLCEQSMARLESWLPASAWADIKYERFVPSKYEICFAGAVGSDWIPAKSLLPMLPAEASRLLDASAIYPTRPGHSPTGDQIGCATMSQADARAVNESLVTAGLGPARVDVAPAYVYDIPATAEHGAIDIHIVFKTVLPHGDSEGSGA